MGIMVECRNCHYVYEGDQWWGEICPRCGSSMVGTLTGGHTIAYQSNKLYDNNFEELPSCSPNWGIKLELADIIDKPGLYRTRDGRMAFVATVGDSFYSCLGMIEGDKSFQHWCKDGRMYPDEPYGPEDIIGKWKTKKSRKKE